MHPRLSLVLLACLLPILCIGQKTYNMTNPEVISGTLNRTTPALRFIVSSPKLLLDTTKRSKPGYHPKNDWPLNSYIDSTALPVGQDPAIQAKYAPQNLTKNLLSDFDGLGPTNVDPADPCIASGPNHVVQMINNVSGAYMKIWNKDGTVAQNAIYLDAITGINGKGDPIVLYDQLEARWLISEFADDNDQLVVAISTSSNPTGGYYVYDFLTPNFPDYPKYAIWDNAFFVTTNEDDESPVYALDKSKMIAGEAFTSAQRFSMPEFPTIDFQAAAPVSLVGSTAPPSNTPGLVMRMADDSWSTAITEDRLEIWEFDVDFNNPSNTTLTGPINIPTAAFDSNLCGYTSFSCIEQPNTILDLDPLREVLMNKVSYRNFGAYQSIVCNHVCDADGNDRAGIRWYELRNEGSGWFIHQQSTYAPNGDDASRWMAGISINENGSIGLAYNISSETIFPSIRYTGRMECDPLGEMTIAETTIIDGSSHNGSNRWGDYSCLDVDPVDGSFWYTAGYAIANSWDTRIAHFDIEDFCYGIQLETNNESLTYCQGEIATFDFDLTYLGGFTGSTTFNVINPPGSLGFNFSTNPVSVDGNYQLTFHPTTSLNEGTYPFQIEATSGAESHTLDLILIIEEDMITVPSLESPADMEGEVFPFVFFDWLDVDHVNRYILEYALDDQFTISHQVIENIVISEYESIVSLLEDTTYYWRVKAINACDTTAYSAVRSFETHSSYCTSTLADDTPIVISSTGTPLISSVIEVDQSGVIMDIGIVDLDITHSYISDLRISLFSPQSVEYVLIDGICTNDDNMFLSIHDSGSSLMSCPPTDGNSYAPIDSLQALFGTDVLGTWTLQIKDKYNQDGGSLNAWSLEVCVANYDCDAQLNLSDNPIENGMYQAYESIISDGVIPTNGNVIFNAGSEVNLAPGFLLESNSSFEVNIGPCTSTN